MTNTKMENYYNSNKLNTNTQFFILTIISLFSFVSFADDVANRQQMVKAIYSLITYVAMLMGIGLMILGGIKLKRSADDPNDKRPKAAIIFFCFFSGALMFNYSGSASVMITSLLGSKNSGYCFVLEDPKSVDLHKENCFDASSSEIVGGLVEKVNDMSDGKGNIVKDNITVIVGLIQIVGLIYFCKGLYGLKLAAEGVRQNETYGKALITLIGSALAFDIMHTLEMIKSTLQMMGVSI
ncbi:Uncharacterised protein [Vibrio cholerae]|nr:Uncharacterised protein [Vibrio cholerae]